MKNVLSPLNTLLLLLITLPMWSFAHNYQIHNIKVDHPWARPTPPGAEMGAVYMSLQNAANTSARLLSVKVDPKIAKRAELHHTLNQDGLLKMRHLKDGKQLSPNQDFLLQPGGAHIMLVGLKQPLTLGDKFDVTLVFAELGELKTQVWVENNSEQKGDEAHHHHH